TPTDRVGHHSVHADNRQKHRHHPQRLHEAADPPEWSYAVADRLRQSLGFGNRQVGIDSRDRLAYCGNQVQWIARGAERDQRTPSGLLGLRPVDGVLGELVGPVVKYVLSHTHYSQPLTSASRVFQPQCFSERDLTRPELAGQTFTHYRHLLTPGLVLSGKIAASHERNADTLEVSGTDTLNDAAGQLIFLEGTLLLSAKVDPAHSVITERG